MRFRNLDRVTHDRYEAASHVVIVTEKDPGGIGSVTLNLDVSAIALADIDRLHLQWVKERRKADGAFVGRKNGRIHVHLVELKTTVGLGTWKKAVKQCEGALLDMLAFLGVLSIGRPYRVFLHIAYTTDAISPATSVAPSTLKFGLGTGAPVASDHGWSVNQAQVLDFTAVPVNKIIRDGAGNATCAVIV